MGIKDEAVKIEADIKADAAALEAKIEAWFKKHFHGNSIAADTEKYNICQAAKEDLKTIVLPPVAAPSATASASTALTGGTIGAA